MFLVFISKGKELTKKIGYIVLSISLVVWCFVFIVPWFDLPKGKIIGITTVLIIVGEVTFYLAVFLLGKTIIAKLKGKLKFWKKPVETDLPGNGPDGRGSIF
jgi:hypothetical protein